MYVACIYLFIYLFSCIVCIYIYVMYLSRQAMSESCAGSERGPGGEFKVLKKSINTPVYTVTVYTLCIEVTR